MLPEGCVSVILSFTSPLDACRSSLVSSTFRSAMESDRGGGRVRQGGARAVPATGKCFEGDEGAAAAQPVVPQRRSRWCPTKGKLLAPPLESDAVWERFLPTDYRDILYRVVTPLRFSSKKELFFHLCNPVLIDAGKKSFKLEKSSGKISYMLSARELSIPWNDVPTYWNWMPTIESRFLEVIVLRTTWWLEIQGKIRTQMLSPNTKYGAYLIMKVSDHAYGLDSIPSEISVEVGNHVSSSVAYLHGHHSEKQPTTCLYNTNRTQMVETRLKAKHGTIPREREDSWSEIELGEFFSGDRDEEVKMALMEVKGCQLKGGLVIDGIEVRPK